MTLAPVGPVSNRSPIAAKFPIAVVAIEKSARIETGGAQSFDGFPVREGTRVVFGPIDTDQAVSGKQMHVVTLDR